MAKKSSNECIIAALMSNGTIKDAAAALGITERTIYDRMNDGDFKALYLSAKADVIRKATCNLNKQIGAAVDTIVSIMNDSEVNAAIRLQAAQTILNNANKFAERLTVGDDRLIEEMKENDYSYFSLQCLSFCIIPIFSYKRRGISIMEDHYAK